jgi:hypothetical protein
MVVAFADDATLAPAFKVGDTATRAAAYQYLK